ncbi:MAG TPA: flagellar biosynthetic protein FliO [Solirubrobacteraceae bacterium]|jgi:flagellar protein FliO/FliZ
MTKSFPLSRATVRVAIFTLAVLVLAPATLAQAFTPATKQAGGGESTPLNLTPSKVGTHTSSSGPSIVRTIVGLLIVIAVIWGLTWILKQVKSGRETRSAGEGLENVATLPLGSGRSLHLVRAGSDHLVVGSAEQGVMPIYRYSEEQAREAGLLGEDGEDQQHPDRHPDPGRAAIQIPGHGRSALDRLREWTVRK